MRKVRQKGTRMELELRSALHRSGLRFRVQLVLLAGSRRRADIVFSRERVAVFVDGCFWHGCPLHGTRPKRNANWWGEKLAKNRERDEDTNDLLGKSGWVVLRIWEHEDVLRAALQVREVVLRRRVTLKI